MHIFFSGIGGNGIGPLALVALDAGHNVSGSDRSYSTHIQDLESVGADIHIGQSKESITALHSKYPIDWFVYASAVAIENPNHPELVFAKANNIKTSKRDELLNFLIDKGGFKLIAVAGTHGKSTTTSMLLWLFYKLGVDISYSTGAEIEFGKMGKYVHGAKYFVYECDEYDRNFLRFKPHLSIISGIDWDHADIYPTRSNYYSAFREFINQSVSTLIWQNDAESIKLNRKQNIYTFKEIDFREFNLPGQVNKQDAFLAVQALLKLGISKKQELTDIINTFPGVSRRFEMIAANIYSDYAHTPPKIRGALEVAEELAKSNVVVVYEGLHNTRQHFIKKQLENLFKPAKFIYVVPSYLAREDKTKALLTPKDLTAIISKNGNAIAAKLNKELKTKISAHVQEGDLVLCFSAGGVGSLDEWLRKNFS